MKYRKLCGRIREYYGTQKAFAAAMGVNVGTLSFKLSGKAEWTQREITRACELLYIPLEEVHVYFFAREVGISQPAN